MSASPSAITPRTARQPAPFDGPLRVLCVDDDPATRRLCVVALAGRWRTVEIVNDGRDALERFRSDTRAFDVLVADHRSSDLGALALVVRLRTLGYLGAVVVVTTYDSPELRAAYRYHGVRTFCAKPLTAPALRAAVAAAAVEPDLFPAPCQILNSPIAQ